MNIRISKNLLPKYYQENKKKLQHKACEKYQNLSKEEKNTDVNVSKISLTIKINWLSVEKNIIE